MAGKEHSEGEPRFSKLESQWNNKLRRSSLRTVLPVMNQLVALN